MPTLKANGISIEYEVQGSGYPVVLISGLAYGRWCWRYALPFLAERFQVITFDNRGAGGSDKAPGPYTTAMMAADTLGLLDGLGIPSAHVIGHSLGSLIAQEMALTAPGRVDGLVLVSSTFGGPRCVPITPVALAAILDRSGDLATLVDRGLRVAFAPAFLERNPVIFREVMQYRLGIPVPGAQYIAQAMAARNHDTEERLSQVRSPTLAITGDEDLVVPAGNTELIRARIPRATAEVLPGVGHMVPVEVPERLSASVRRFLEGLSVRATG